MEEPDGRHAERHRARRDLVGADHETRGRRHAPKRMEVEFLRQPPRAHLTPFHERGDFIEQHAALLACRDRRGEFDHDLVLQLPLRVRPPLAPRVHRRAHGELRRAGSRRLSGVAVDRVRRVRGHRHRAHRTRHLAERELAPLDLQTVGPHVHHHALTSLAARRPHVARLARVLAARVHALPFAAVGRRDLQQRARVDGRERTLPHGTVVGEAHVRMAGERDGVRVVL